MTSKLLVLQTHPIQYLAPLYRCLAERGKIDLVVGYRSDNGVTSYYDVGFGKSITWDIDLLSGYRAIFLNKSKSVFGSVFGHSYQICHLIRSEKPDWAYVYGYNSIVNWMLVYCARRHGTKLIYSADSNVRIEVNSIWTAAKKLILRVFFSNIDVYLYSAEANRDYLLKYGVAPSKLKWCPFAIDINRFMTGGKGKSSLKRYHFLWIGKLDRRKRVGDFIAALLRLRQEGHIFNAVIAGAGEDERSVRELGEPLFRDGRLDYVGFLNQSEVPPLLAASDIFVFTSEDEPYGLAVTEAAASGCALIATEGSGCVGALGSAQPGKNVLIFQSADVATLYTHMKRLLCDPSLRKNMQEQSQRIAKLHDISCAAETIEEIISNA